MTAAKTSLKESWAKGTATVGAWLSIPTGFTAEIAGRAGFDYVCLDEQHGLIDYQSAVTMLQALDLGTTTSLVRVKTNTAETIGRMLDAGAGGVIVPMVNTAADAAAAVASCRYAPEGSRSFGPTRPALANPEFTTAGSNDSVACIPMIETVESLSNLDAILAIPGIDAVYVGPADLSLTLGLPPRNNDGEPLFDEALETVVRSCKAAGVIPGCHTSPALVDRRLEQGFQMITVASDEVVLTEGFADAVTRFSGR